MKKSEELLQFINHSPSAYHTAEEIRRQLQKAGVVVLEETQDWTPYFDGIKDTGGNFAVLRGGTLVAFRLPPLLSTHTSAENLPQIALWAAHTDSPCLKIKNKGIKILDKFALQLSIESYGGVKENSFLDRELSIAGRVAIENEKNEIELRLIDFEKPVAIIPSLAAHLGEKNSKLNAENHLRPFFFIEDTSSLQSSDNDPNMIFESILAKKLNVEQKKILGYDLFVYPCEKAHFLGMDNDFIASRALDNLSMTHAGLSGFLEAIKVNPHPPKNKIDCLALFNHEEIGSLSDEGALSFFLERILRRVGNAFFEKNKNDCIERILAHSFLLSADVSHSVHPNYLEAHSEFHKPKMGQGIVLKRHAELRYATQANGEALFSHLLQQHNIPYQYYNNRSDKMSGSTIGAILTSRLGVNGADVGCAMLAMHSAKELMNAKDHEQICNIARIFFCEELGKIRN